MNISLLDVCAARIRLRCGRGAQKRSYHREFGALVLAVCTEPTGSRQNVVASIVEQPS